MCESSPEQQINICFTKIALRANDICYKVIKNLQKREKKNNDMWWCFMSFCLNENPIQSLRPSLEMADELLCSCKRIRHNKY